jgi:hypothetical protein
MAPGSDARLSALHRAPVSLLVTPYTVRIVRSTPYVQQQAVRPPGASRSIARRLQHTELSLLAPRSPHERRISSPPGPRRIGDAETLARTGARTLVSGCWPALAQVPSIQLLLASTSEAKWWAGSRWPHGLLASPQSVPASDPMSPQVALMRDGAGGALVPFRVPSMHLSIPLSLPHSMRVSVHAPPLPTLGGLFPSNIRDAVTSFLSPTPEVLDIVFIVPLLPVTLNESPRSAAFFRRPDPPPSGNGLMKLHSFPTGLRTT